jgi:hypothetical protein
MSSHGKALYNFQKNLKIMSKVIFKLFGVNLRDKHENFGAYVSIHMRNFPFLDRSESSIIRRISSTIHATNQED